MDKSSPYYIVYQFIDGYARKVYGKKPKMRNKILGKNKDLYFCCRFFNELKSGSGYSLMRDDFIKKYWDDVKAGLIKYKFDDVAKTYETTPLTEKMGLDLPVKKDESNWAKAWEMIEEDKPGRESPKEDQAFNVYNIDNIYSRLSTFITENNS